MALMAIYPGVETCFCGLNYPVYDEVKTALVEKNSRYSFLGVLPEDKDVDNFHAKYPIYQEADHAIKIMKETTEDRIVGYLNSNSYVSKEEYMKWLLTPKNAGGINAFGILKSFTEGLYRNINCLPIVLYKDPSANTAGSYIICFACNRFVNAVFVNIDHAKHCEPNSIAKTVIHEVSHLILGTDDYKGINNAETFANVLLNAYEASLITGTRTRSKKNNFDL